MMSFTRVSIFLGIISLCHVVLGQVTDSHTVGNGKTFCKFNSKEYSPGDVWYPQSRATFKDVCIRCICLNTGQLNCTQSSCVEKCPDSSSSDPCCQTCSSSQPPFDFTPPLHEEEESKNNEKNGEKSLTNIGSGEEFEEDEEENSDFASCLHQGRVYREGEAFTANVSGLPIATVDQCMQCQCQNGMVLCAMKSCSSFKCSSSELLSEQNSKHEKGSTCCERCAGWKLKEIRGQGPFSAQRTKLQNAVQNQKNAVVQQKISNAINRQMSQSGFSPESSISFSQPAGNILNSKNKGDSKTPSDDCISSGSFYVHGSTWHPVIGPFGTMECVSCKCNHGQIECGRLKCPTGRDISCSKPVKVEGHCCPMCLSSGEKYGPINVDSRTMCVPNKQEITVFKSVRINLNGSEVIEFSFLRPRRNVGLGSPDSQIERHEWKLSGTGVEEFSTQYLSMAQFESLNYRKSYLLLGATNEKNVEKFTRREKKLEKRCNSSKGAVVESPSCSIRILSLEKSLRLHKLISRTQCLSNERPLLSIK